MDESAVKQQATAHGDAVVAGDMRTAGQDLTKEAMGQAGDVMGRLPKPLAGAEVLDVTADGGAFVARIAYRGQDSETVVASRWEERDGSPKITNLSLE